MPTQLDIRQSVLRSSLTMAQNVAGATVDSVLIDLDADDDQPCRPFATLVPDAFLHFNPSTTVRADGSSISVTPISSTVPTVPASTINFQTGATTGATFDNLTFPSTTVGQYRRLGFSLLSTGHISAIWGAQVASVGALSNPGLVIDAGYPIGYIDLEATAATAFKTIGSATNIIESSVSGTSRIWYFQGDGSTSSGITRVYPTVFAGSSAELTTAISTVSAGGVIVLYQGFTISSSFTVPSGVLLLGRLAQSVITVTAGGAIVMSAESIMRDVQFTTALSSGTLITVSGNRTTLQTCKFSVPSNSTTVCVNVTGNSNHIERSLFTGVAAPSTGVGIKYTSGSNNMDTDCVFLT